MTQVFYSSLKENKNKISFISIILSLLSFSVFILTLIYCSDFASYKYIFALPLTYAITCLFFQKAFKNISNSPVFIITVFTYFIRCCICPLLFALGGYISFFTYRPSDVYYTESIFLLCAETIVVFAVSNKYLLSNKTNKKEKSFSINNKITLIIVLLLFFVVGVYFLIPELQKTNTFLFKTNFSKIAEINYDDETIVARGSYQRYLYSLWNFIWPILRVMISPFCISLFYKKIQNKSLSIFLSSVSLLLSCLFVGGDNISPFICVILGILIIKHLYGKRANFGLSLLVIAFVTFFIIVFSSKIYLISNWRGTTGVASFSQTINAYFPWIDNSAITLSLTKQNYFEHLFYDLYYAIPFKETLFGLSGTRLNDLFNETANLSGCITPFSSQISYYLTGVGGIFIIYLLAKIAFKTEKKAMQTGYFWEYFACLYLSFYIVFSLSVYSFSIFIRTIICVYLPIKVIINLGVRKQKYVIEK